MIGWQGKSLANPLNVYLIIINDFRTSYSWTCVQECQVEACGMECHGGFVVPTFHHAFVSEMAHCVASVVWGKSGMGCERVCVGEDLGSVDAPNGASGLSGS